MRLGFIGPAKSDVAALEQAAKLLICDLEVDTVIYLGEDEALHEFMAKHESDPGDVVYGDGKELMFKRFGPRCFFCPGPLETGHLGLLDDQSETGGVMLEAITLSGEVCWSEPIQGRGAKVMVAP